MNNIKRLVPTIVQINQLRKEADRLRDLAAQAWDEYYHHKPPLRENFELVVVANQKYDDAFNSWYQASEARRKAVDDWLFSWPIYF